MHGIYMETAFFKASSRNKRLCEDEPSEVDFDNYEDFALFKGYR